MENLIILLRKCPNPKKTWKEILKFLITDSPIARGLGAETLLSGAIMETFPERQRNESLELIQGLAETTWEWYEKQYQDVAEFAEDRRRLSEAVNGLLSAPQGRPKSSDSLTKKNKAWSMPNEDWEWLESQSNQSETLRLAIAMIKKELQR